LDENWGFLETEPQDGSGGESGEDSDEDFLPPPLPKKKKKQERRRRQVVESSDFEEESDEEEPPPRRPRGRPTKISDLEEKVDKLADVILKMNQQEQRGQVSSGTGRKSLIYAPLPKKSKGSSSKRKGVPASDTLRSVLEDAMDDDSLELPDLEQSGAKVLELTGVSPLRVTKRLAPSLLWVIYGAHTSAGHFVVHAQFKKLRNEREALTLARALDIAICQEGITAIAEDPMWEVLLRRFHALKMADAQDSWKIAQKLEELPPTGGSVLPPKVDKDLLTLVDLDLKMAKALAGKAQSSKDE
jgi:hypothetical protein